MISNVVSAAICWAIPANRLKQFRLERGLMQATLAKELNAPCRHSFTEEVRHSLRLLMATAAKRLTKKTIYLP